MHSQARRWRLVQCGDVHTVQYLPDGVQPSTRRIHISQTFTFSLHLAMPRHVWLSRWATTTPTGRAFGLGDAHRAPQCPTKNAATGRWQRLNDSVSQRWRVPSRCLVARSGVCTIWTSCSRSCGGLLVGEPVGEHSWPYSVASVRCGLPGGAPSSPYESCCHTAGDHGREGCLQRLQHDQSRTSEVLGAAAISVHTSTTSSRGAVRDSD
jgi:hypothetical protein